MLAEQLELALVCVDGADGRREVGEHGVGLAGLARPR